MKNRFLVVAFLLLSAGAFAQVSYETNDPNLNPVPMGYLGWNDNDNTTLILALFLRSVGWFCQHPFSKSIVMLSTAKHLLPLSTHVR